MDALSLETLIRESALGGQYSIKQE